MSDERAASIDIDKGLERDLEIALGLVDEDGIEDSSQQEQDEKPNEKPNENESEGSQDDLQDQEEQPSEETDENEDSTDHDPEIEVGGERFKASEIQEWRKGYLRNEDYTRKTQQIGDQRREVEQLRQRLQPLLAVEQYLAANPQVAANLQRVLQQGVSAPVAPVQGRAAPQQQPTTAPQQGYGMMDPVLEQRLSRIERFEQDQQLDRALQAVKASADMERQNIGLPPLTEEEWQATSHRLMDEALQSRNSDLTQVYRMSSLRDEWYQQGLAKAREQAQKEQTTRQRTQAGAVIGGSPRGSQAPAPQQAAPKNFSDATKAAYRELRESGGGFFTE